MCITGADVRAQEELMVWDILCDNCNAKAEALLKDRNADSLFDIDKDEYGFCSECSAEIEEAFQRLEEDEMQDEIL